MLAYVSSPRSLFKASAALAAAAAALTEAATFPLAAAAKPGAGPDPIFPAIERNLDLWRAHYVALNEADRTQMENGCDSDVHRAADDVAGEACSAQVADFFELLSIVPTTLAGLFAYIDHLGHDAGYGPLHIEARQSAVIFATIKTAIRNIAAGEA